MKSLAPLQALELYGGTAATVWKATRDGRRVYCVTIDRNGASVEPAGLRFFTSKKLAIATVQLGVLRLAAWNVGRRRLAASTV